MYKVWSPYGFSYNDDPITIARFNSRGVDADWMKKAAAAAIFADEFEKYPLAKGHTLVQLAPVADYEYYSCFPAGTEVRMADSTLKPIENIALGDEVVTHRRGAGKVISLMSRPYEGAGIRLGICGLLDDITSTAEHKYFIIPKEQVECSVDKRKHCKPGTCQNNALCESRGCSRSHISYELQEVAASNIRPGDYVVVPVPDRGVGSPSWRWSTAFTTVAGYFLAEGCYIKAPGTQAREGVSLCFHQDEEATLGVALATAVELLKDSYKGIRINGPYHGNGKAIVYQIHSRGLADRLYSLFGDYAGQKALHPGVFGQPPETLRKLLACYMDGDGTCSEYTDPAGYSHDSYSMTTVSRKLALDLQWVFGKLGVPAMLCRGTNTDPDTGDTRDFYHCDLSNTNGMLFEGLSYKHREVTPAQEKQHCFMWNGYVCRPVRSTALVELNCTVYNIEVEGDHSYTVGNGVAVRNCNVNGDMFKTAANKQYHNTFLNANAFTEHVNQDPTIGFGKPIATAYNDKLHRIELLVDVDNVKNASILHSLEQGKPVNWSMSCYVDYDQCNVCGNKATSPKGPCDQPLDVPSPGYCKHASQFLGAMLKNGHRVGVDNPHPRFFDISHVKTPAEVMALTLRYRKAAAANGPISFDESGVGLAIRCGLELPLYLRASLPSFVIAKSALAGKLAAMEKTIPMTGANLVGAEPDSGGAAKNNALSNLLADVKSGKLKKEQVLQALRDEGIIADIDTFAKLEGATPEEAKEATAKLPLLFSYLSQHNLLTDTACNGTYDEYETPVSMKLAASAKTLAPAMSLMPAYAKARAIAATPKQIKQASTSADDSSVSSLLRKYAAYQLSELAATCKDSKAELPLLLTVIARTVNYR